MKLDMDFPELVHLVQRIKAPLVYWEPKVNDLEPPDVRVVLKSGLEIDVSEIEVRNDGLLVYKGERIVVYIKDTYESVDYVKDGGSARRYHVVECGTLELARRQHRYERYIATNRQDGLFPVDAIDFRTQRHVRVNARLRICKRCLSKLNYDNYRRESSQNRDIIWQNFNLSKFLSQYEPTFRELPKWTDKTAPVNDYTFDWEQISWEYREKIGFRCETARTTPSGCGVRAEEFEDRPMFQVHHINGVKSNNRPENLVCLCVLCHSKQPQHGWVIVPLMQRVRILELRRKQHIRSPSE